MPCIDLFPLKIYKNKIENCEEIYRNLKPHVSEWYKIFSGERQNFETTYINEIEYKGNKFPGNHLHKLDLFSPLIDILNPMILEYWNELNIVSSLKPKIFEMWMHRSKADSFINMHNHIPAIVNGVVYLQKETDHGNIVFENPSSLIAALMPVNFYNNKKVSFSVEQELEICTGDVIIFPGWLNHKVKQGLSDDRMTLTFNCIGEGHHPSTIES